MKKGSQTLFNATTDASGIEYFFVNVSAINPEAFRPQDVYKDEQNSCSMLAETLPLESRTTGRFSGDLTSRDDLILAILSLFLVLLIESMLTTILLRSRDGMLSTASFSIRQFCQLVREIKFHHVFRGQLFKKRKSRPHINFHLVALSFFVFAFSLGLQIGVLVFSTPHLVDVTNDAVSFTFGQHFIPDRKEVWENGGIATRRTCTSIRLIAANPRLKIEQGRTSLQACLISNHSALEQWDSGFEKTEDLVNMTLTSEVHAYGTEHFVSIGDVTVSYITRVYYSGDDRKFRLMSSRGRHTTREAIRVDYVHKEIVAYLFSYYTRETNDTRMNLKRLQSLNFQFDVEDGQEIDVLQVNGAERFFRVASSKYTTKVEAVIPQGVAAFRLIDSFLKGSSKVTTSSGTRYDLFLGSGNIFPRSSVLWRETSRKINWASLSILTSAVFLAVICLRHVLKPVSSPELAQAWVAKGLLASKREGHEGEIEKIDLTLGASTDSVWASTEEEDY